MRRAVIEFFKRLWATPGCCEILVIIAVTVMLLMTHRIECPPWTPNLIREIVESKIVLRLLQQVGTVLMVGYLVHHGWEGLARKWPHSRADLYVKFGLAIGLVNYVVHSVHI